MDKALAQAVYIRDRWFCRHCKSRAGLHPHHLVYKSHGGTDEMNNLIALCAECHLVGIHGGKLKVEVVKILENDALVKFTRVDGWKPRG